MPFSRHDSPRSHRLESLAVRAAHLYIAGAAPTVAAAIELLRADENQHGDTRGLTAGRVRRHVEAMTMAQLGAGGNLERRAAILEIGEEIMTLLEHGLESATTLLVGRAAKGLLDGDVTLHIRVYCTAPIGVVAGLLVDAGHEEPRFVTARTRHGRLDRIEFSDGAVAIVITRCAPTLRTTAERDLHSGRPIAMLDLDGVRAAIAALRTPDQPREMPPHA